MSMLQNTVQHVKFNYRKLKLSGYQDLDTRSPTVPSPEIWGSHPDTSKNSAYLFWIGKNDTIQLSTFSLA